MFLQKIKNKYAPETVFAARVPDGGPERITEIKKRAKDDLLKFVEDVVLWAKEQNLEPSTPKIKNDKALISCLNEGILISIRLDKDSEFPGFRVHMHLTDKMQDRIIKYCRKMSEKATKNDGYYNEVYWSEKSF